MDHLHQYTQSFWQKYKFLGPGPDLQIQKASAGFFFFKHSLQVILTNIMKVINLLLSKTFVKYMNLQRSPIQIFLKETAEQVNLHVFNPPVIDWNISG